MVFGKNVWELEILELRQRRGGVGGIFEGELRIFELFDMLQQHSTTLFAVRSCIS